VGTWQWWGGGRVGVPVPWRGRSSGGVVAVGRDGSVSLWAAPPEESVVAVKR